KVNASGSGLVYSTYLGGSFGNDSGEGIAVDGSGQAYVTGHTSSGTFPVANAFQPLLSGGGDAFVAELNATGSALGPPNHLGGGPGATGVRKHLARNVTVQRRVST